MEVNDEYDGDDLPLSITMGQMSTMGRVSGRGQMSGNG